MSNFLPFILGSPIPYYPRERKAMEKREYTKNGCDTRVSVLGALKLDHLQPVELILSQNFSCFLTFILGVQLSITPERGRQNTWEKGIHQKWVGHRGFSAWGIQTGPFGACWADFVPTFSLLLYLHTGSPIIYYPRERKAEYEKREFTRNGWDTGVLVPRGI